MNKDIEAYGVTVNEYAVWLNDDTCILRGGDGTINFKLYGIIRGNDSKPLTYFLNSYRDLDGFKLDEWIYYIKKI